MFGVDYAFAPHPSTSALKGAGVKFVMRYISNTPANDTNGKNLISSELKTLRGAGISVGVVVEYYAKRMMEGHAQGVADAKHADSVVKALGMAGLPIYFAADWDATPGDQTGINNYLDGAASVIGRNRTGVYGSYYVVKRAFDAKKVAYGWQTYAWSGGQWESRAQLRQYQNGWSLGGASVDKCDARKDDFGQWPRPKASSPVKPAPKPSAEYKADGKLSLAGIADHVKVPVGSLLRKTAIHYGKFDDGIFDYLGDLTDGKIDSKAAVRAGSRFWTD